MSSTHLECRSHQRNPDPQFDEDENRLQKSRLKVRNGRTRADKALRRSPESKPISIESTRQTPLSRSDELRTAIRTTNSKCPGAPKNTESR
jgi:hypothetical protein